MLAYVPLIFALAAETPPAAPDTIAFASLRQYSMVKDCDAPLDKDQKARRICRVRVQRTEAELRSRLAAGDFWRDGDELSFVHEAKADQVELSGGVQVPMSRLSGTNLWTVTIRADELDRAVISYIFVPVGKGITPPARFTPKLWRGPKAAALPDSTRALKGRLVDQKLASRFLAAPRDITVYVPPARGNEPISAVVYAGDGGAVRALSYIVDTLVTTGRLPRILLVGMHSDNTTAPGAEHDGRTLEYLSGIGDSTRFIQHEQFFLEEVMPWAEREFGAPVDRVQRGVFGFSNSAAFAIDMGLRHPELFGRVLAFSPAGRNAEMPEGELPFKPEFYLEAGIYEWNFHAKALAWSRLFTERGITHALDETISGHDWTQWEVSFPAALEWAFPAAGKAGAVTRVAL